MTKEQEVNVLKAEAYDLVTALDARTKDYKSATNQTQTRLNQIADKIKEIEK